LLPMAQELKELDVPKDSWVKSRANPTGKSNSDPRGGAGQIRRGAAFGRPILPKPDPLAVSR
jgi:hypothetical protein